MFHFLVFYLLFPVEKIQLKKERKIFESNLTAYAFLSFAHRRYDLHCL